MRDQVVFQILGVILGILAIVTPLFKKNIRNWLLKTIERFVLFVRRQANRFMFRATLLLIFHYLLLFLLNRIGITPLDLAIPLSLVFILWLFGVYFIVYRSSQKELTIIHSKLQALQTEVQILSQSRRVELDNVNGKWKEFIDMLSSHPGYEIVGAYLSLSRPLQIEKNILLIGLPEVVLRASEGIDLERITPLLTEYFGNPYVLRAIAYESPKDDGKKDELLAGKIVTINV